MAKYMVATIGALAALSTVQTSRAAEEPVLSSSETDTLEFRIDSAPLFDEKAFINSPNYRTPVSRPQKNTYSNQNYRVPRTLDKGTPMNLSHPGRMYAMRMHGKDNRN